VPPQPDEELPLFQADSPPGAPGRSDSQTKRCGHPRPAPAASAAHATANGTAAAAASSRADGDAGARAALEERGGCSPGGESPARQAEGAEPSQKRARRWAVELRCKPTLQMDSCERLLRLDQPLAADEELC